MRVAIPALFMLLFLIRPALGGQSAKEWIKEGNILYNEGEYDRALKKYEEGLLTAPDSDIVNYDIAAALYKTGAYEEAVSHFEKALLSEDEGIRRKASYNLGNAKYNYGLKKEDEDIAGAIELLTQSLRHYEKALEVDPDDDDARHNYEFVSGELERLKKKAEKMTEDGPEEGEGGQKEDGSSGKEGPEDRENRGSRDSQGGEKSESEEESGKDRGQGEKEGDSASKGAYPQDKEKGEGDERFHSAAGAEGNETGAADALREGDATRMNEEEARMLLENYSQEEEPGSLYRPRIETKGPSGPEKDW